MSSPFPERSLGEVVELASGQVDPREEPYSMMPHVGGDNIESATGRISGTQTASQLGLKSGKYLFDDTYVLYSKIRPYLNKVAAPDFSGICSADIYPIRPVNGEIDKRFLVYVLRSKHFLAYAAKHSTRTNIPKINRPALLAYCLPLPSLSEQKRIADILDKADGVRRQRQEVLRLNDDVIYSVYQERFGNPITNSKGFQTRKLDDMCNLVRGSSPRPKSDPRYYGGPVRRLMVEDITRDGRLVTPQIDSLTEEGAKKSRPCKAGTVVMVVSGNVGLPAKLAVDACIHDGFVGLQDLDTTVIRPDFLVLTLEMLKVTHERFKAGAIWQNLTTHQIKAMEIPLPPLEEQDAFDQFVARHQNFTERLKAKGSEEDDLFNSLVQRAFKGEL